MRTGEKVVGTAMVLGVLIVALVVPVAAGNTLEITGEIVTPGGLQADFAGEPREGIRPLTVSFKDLSTGEITKWAWDFNGDGVIDSKKQNPRHVFLVPGSYTVTLTVTGTGGSDTEIKEKYITVQEKIRRPIARFTLDRHVGKAPLTIQFSDRSLFNPTSYFWQFGDGTTSNAQNPSHTYQKSGFYFVRLRVTNAAGSDSSHGWVIVFPRNSPSSFHNFFWGWR